MAKKAVFVGIDLGGTGIKGGLVSQGGSLLIEEKVATEAEGGVGHVLDRMADLIHRLVPRNTDDQKVPGVGIGVPGQVNFKEGIVTEPPNLPGWDVVPVKKEMEKRVGLPVTVDNDANVAALGEFAYGAGRGCTEMLMVTLGTGVGGGLILSGAVYRGAVGGAGEFGHMIVMKDGPVCGCGRRGCIEAFVGTAGILRQVREKLFSGKKSLLSDVGPEEMTPKDVYDAAQRGDEVAVEVLHETGRVLGIGLGSVANLLNLERIVVGGGVASAGELILEPARESLGEIAHSVSRESVEVVSAMLGNKAGLLGAARLVMGEGNFLPEADVL